MVFMPSNSVSVCVINHTFYKVHTIHVRGKWRLFLNAVESFTDFTEASNVEYTAGIIDLEFVTSAKKFANFNEFSEIKKKS